MKATLALFKTNKGMEKRLYVPEWNVDGYTFEGVNVRPHGCNPAVCKYGDHVHVSVYDTPVEIISDGVEFNAKQREPSPNIFRLSETSI